MDDAIRQEIEQWLLKSQRDLRAAHLLFESEEALLDVVVYHCQQSAEKALKAYLTYRNVVFQKTHDLDVLLNLCLPFELGFGELREIAKTLTPYAVEFRALLNPGRICPHPQPFSPRRRELEFMFPLLLGEG